MKHEISKKNEIIISAITVAAGFPSPAENYIEEHLDLNKYLITFLCFSPMLSQYFLLVIIYLSNKKSLSKNKNSLISNSVKFNFLKNIYEIFFFPTQIYIISLISLGIVFNYEIQIFYFVSSITLISIIRQLYIGFNKLN